MDAKIILSFSIIFAIVVSGCVINSPLQPNVSDDDLYLQALSECSAQSNAEQQGSAQFSARQIAGTELKVKATTCYNKIFPLKVSSKFEHSKTAYLQAMKGAEGVAEYMMTMSDAAIQKNVEYSIKGTIPAEFTKFQNDEQNYILFTIAAFDSNVCSADGEKYPNIASACKSLSAMKK